MSSQYFLTWGSREGGIWLLRMESGQFSVFIDRLAHISTFSIENIPSHNTSDLNHMHAQLCIGIKW